MEPPDLKRALLEEKAERLIGCTAVLCFVAIIALAPIYYYTDLSLGWLVVPFALFFGTIIGDSK